MAKGAASASVRSSVVETQSQVAAGRTRQTEFQPAAAPGNLPPRRFKRSVLLACAAELSQLPPVKRIAAVRAKLDELNGANRIRLTHHLDGEKLAQVEAYLTGKAADLTPLMALTDLKKLSIYESVPWQDLSCLKFLPLEELTCSEDAAYKNNGTLRAIKTLRTINGMPAEQFWQKLGVDQE